MRILVTGHRGHVGAPVAAHLRRLDHEVVGFDRADGADGSDLLDAAAVRRAVDGCDSIVHLGAIPHDTAGSPEDIMAVNVLGTWHVLLAAEAAHVGRVIHFSSVAVFGVAEGERLPDYFPVDDVHPRRATHPYGLSKCLTEDLCAAFTNRTGIPTVALRPVWVWDPGMYQRIEARWRADPSSEWEPSWEFGDFVDVRDVASAVQQALTVPLTGHHRVLLCAADVAATRPSLDIASRLASAVPIRDPVLFQHEPRRALFDCSAAVRLLGWQPQRTWSNRGLVQATGRSARDIRGTAHEW
jgi:UDP-glucose 4-epimerase